MENCNSPRLAIVVMGYNRAQPLRNLLDALNNLVISTEIPLIISIDGGGTPEINSMAEKYQWPHGEKKVVIHSPRLGLRNHFFWAGDQTQSYDNILFLEDDLYPAPYAVEAALQLCSHYSGDSRIAAGSLYSPLLCEFKDIKFPRIEDGSDYFLFAHPYWGTIWMKQAWREFRRWFETYECKPELLPSNVARWRDGSSFKKVFIQYLIETNRTCVYPKVSYVTNMGVAGENNAMGLYCFQTNLSPAKPNFRFTPYEEFFSKYDAFMEVDPDVLKRYCKELQDYDFTVDLKQLRTHVETPYVLTTRPVREPVLTFSDKMKPVENGIIFNIAGTGISLARSENVNLSSDNLYRFSAMDIMANYRIHPKTAGYVFKYVSRNFLKNKLKQK